MLRLLHGTSCCDLLILQQDCAGVWRDPLCAGAARDVEESGGLLRQSIRKTVGGCCLPVFEIDWMFHKVRLFCCPTKAWRFLKLNGVYCMFLKFEASRVLQLVAPRNPQHAQHGECVRTVTYSWWLQYWACATDIWTASTPDLCEWFVYVSAPPHPLTWYTVGYIDPASNDPCLSHYEDTLSTLTDWERNTPQLQNFWGD